jgi:hypothetical protein
MPTVSQQYQPPLVSLADVVRNYQENGVKFLLQHGLNMRDLLHLDHCPEEPLLDFTRQTVERTSFVKADYHHVLSDLLVRVPYKQHLGEKATLLSIYILLEHMSEPDPFMKLFLLEYVAQAYCAQVRALGHVRKVEPILDPVLPIVFYTGPRTWNKLADLSELVKNGVALAEYLPGEKWQPRFINLGTLPDQQLKTDGGYLGQALRILREHRGRGEEFLHLFREVLTALDSMPAEEQQRWRELLQFLLVLAYHGRTAPEQQELQRVVDATVQHKRHKQETNQMSQTIAEALRDEGKVAGIAEGEVRSRKQTLKMLLLKRFRKVSPAILATIDGTNNPTQLDEWLCNVVGAKSVREVGIGKGPRN